MPVSCLAFVASDNCEHGNTHVGDDPWHFTELHSVVLLGPSVPGLLLLWAGASLWVAVGAQVPFALGLLACSQSL